MATQRSQVALVLASLVLLLCPGFTCAESDAVSVRGKVRIPGRERDVRGVKVLLHIGGGQELVAYCRSDGTFQFLNVPAGSHLMDVYVIGWAFHQVRVDVSGRQSGLVMGQTTANRQPLPYPFILEPVARLDYFKYRRPLTLKSLTSSYYFWFIGLAVLGMIVLPMMPKVDQAELEEFNKQMEEQGGMMNMLLGGGGGGTGAASTGGPALPASGGGRSSKKSK